MQELHKVMLNNTIVDVRLCKRIFYLASELPLKLVVILLLFCPVDGVNLSLEWRSKGAIIYHVILWI